MIVFDSTPSRLVSSCRILQASLELEWLTWGQGMNKAIRTPAPSTAAVAAHYITPRLSRWTIVLLVSAALLFGMLLADARGDITPAPSNAAWTVTEAPLPSSSFGSYIVALSCPAAESCIAIAGNVTPEYWADGSGYILTETDGHWSEQAIPLPPGATAPLDLIQVRLTCAQVGYCVAFTNSLEGHSGYILTETAGVWTSQAEPPAPDGSSLVIAGLACPQANACVAVGSNTARTIPVILTESGTGWSVATAPQPSKALCPGGEQDGCALTAVSCPLVNHCTAIGTYVHEEEVYPQEFYPVVVNYVLTQTPGEWSASALPPNVPRTENSGENTPPVYAPITALACPQIERCVAISRSIQGRLFAPAQELFSTGLAYIFSESTPGAWSTATLPLPAEDNGGVVTSPEHGLLGGGTTDITSLACPDVNTCVTGGLYSTGIFSQSVPTMTSEVLLSATSGIWQAVTTHPTNRVDPTEVGVSCAAIGSCVAAVPLVSPGTDSWALDIDAGGTWSEQPLPTPTTSWRPYSSTNSSAMPDVVACPAVNACTVAADYVDPSGKPRILMSFQGGAIAGTVAPPASGSSEKGSSGGGSSPPNGEGSPTPSPAGSSCPAYTAIDSRGSGETAYVHGQRVVEVSPPAAYFTSEFRHRHPSSSLVLVSNPYPAVGFSLTDIRKLLNFIGAGLGIGPLGAYHASVVDGEKWLRREIASEIGACPGTKLLLVGYSQGAQVTGDVYQRYVSATQRKHILAVALFGDPYFNPSDATADRGGFLHSRPGVLGKRRSFGGDRRIVSYCHYHDPICQLPNLVELVKYRFTQHDNYPPAATAAAKAF